MRPPVIGEYSEKDELYDPFEHRDKKDSNSYVKIVFFFLQIHLFHFPYKTKTLVKPQS